MNHRADPERVGLVTNRSVTSDGGTIRITLPPVSWTAVELARQPPG